MYNDKNLTCADCGQEFVFTASEQDFYAQRGFTEPRRCPAVAPAARPPATLRVAAARTAATAPVGAIRPAAPAAAAVRWRWLRRPRSRPPRDVRGHVLELWHARPRSRSARPAASPSTAATASAASAAADLDPLGAGRSQDPGRQPARVFLSGGQLGRRWGGASARCSLRAVAHALKCARSLAHSRLRLAVPAADSRFVAV